METFHSGELPKQQYEALTNQTIALLLRLTAQESEDVIIENSQNIDKPVADDGIEAETHIIGQRRMLEAAEDRSVAIAVYDEAERHRLADITAETVPGDYFGLPIGHVELQTGSERGANLGATIYVYDKGVRAHMSFNQDVENPSSDQASSCYDLARTVGLGEEWTAALLQYLHGESEGLYEAMVTFESWQVMRLNSELIKYMDE